MGSFAFSFEPYFHRLHLSPPPFEESEPSSKHDHRSHQDDRTRVRGDREKRIGLGEDRSRDGRADEGCRRKAGRQHPHSTSDVVSLGR